MELLGELPVDLVIAEYVTAETEEQNAIEALGCIQEHGNACVVRHAFR